MTDMFLSANRQSHPCAYDEIQLGPFPENRVGALPFHACEPRPDCHIGAGCATDSRSTRALKEEINAPGPPPFLVGPAHNHPSVESTPSEGDIKVTRDLIRAEQLLKMEVLDHVSGGNGNF